MYRATVNKGFVAYIRGKYKLYEVPVNLEHREEIQLIVDEIFAIIQSERLPKRTTQKTHCIDCCYRNICV